MKILKRLLVLVLLIVLAGGVYYFFFLPDTEKELTLTERRWIEENKNTVIDIGILNNIPVFSASSEALIFSFLNALEEETELAFNKVPFSLESESNENYAFKIKEEKAENDILLYVDNYVLLKKQDLNYLELSEIPDIKIGVFRDDLERVSFYLGDDFEYVTFSNYENLFTDEEEELDAIVVPKLQFLPKIIESPYQIVYNITDLKTNYVLELKGEEVLNDIIGKYYQIWVSDNYDRKFSERFNEIYFSSNNIHEKDRNDFRGKRYYFGFVNQVPYNLKTEEEVRGINLPFLNNFMEITGIEIRFIAYDDYDSLLAGFNNGDFDFFMNNQLENYEVSVMGSRGVYDNRYLVVSIDCQNYNINSLRSLKNYDIGILPNPYLENLLTQKELEYQIVELDNITRTPLIIDEHSFNFYRQSHFDNYKINYVLEEKSRNFFIFKNTVDNRVFANYFDFYLSFVNKERLTNRGFLESKEFYQLVDYRQVVLIVGIVLGSLGFLYLTTRFIIYKGKQGGVNSKEYKLKYIDDLTSLKNRSYLNDNLEKWDNSEAYPQAILIIDLNNIAYINDNYGHAEGDSVIKEAANILIRNQEENSEVIRTSGNEFLVYMVGYEGKKVEAYVKRLQKEFKNLSHEFGATIGFSMIEDEIKTVDDAINEATIDMRNKKVLE